MSVKIVMQCGSSGPFKEYKYKEGHTVARTKRDVVDGEAILVLDEKDAIISKHFSGVRYGELLHKIIIK